MDGLIKPDIFNGDVKAFFTRKSPGTDTGKICDLVSVPERHIFMPVQKHTDRVFVLGTDLTRVTADAVVTRMKGILIGVRVADCVPILLYDRKSSAVGAVHAGWRGTASRILRKTIETMAGLFGSVPADIMVAIGPSIRWRCYDVGREVKEAVCEATGEGVYCVSEKEKCFIDLSSANRLQALSSGIPEENIWGSAECTRCNPDAFYSYRYSRKHKGGQGGFIGVF